ncbi:MAG: acyl carrier protein [Oscillospiraceae bacterium]|nr:acyl carrier protein [Oscillospiraceae bacterium]
MSISEELIILLKNNIDELEDTDFDETTELISGGFIESFDIIGLIGVFEEAFGVELSLEDLKLEQFNTVQSIASVISEAPRKG